MERNTAVVGFFGISLIFFNSSQPSLPFLLQYQRSGTPSPTPPVSIAWTIKPCSRKSFATLCRTALSTAIFHLLYKRAPNFFGNALSLAKLNLLMINGDAATDR